jgi:cobalamin synthase
MASSNGESSSPSSRVRDGWRWGISTFLSALRSLTAVAGAPEKRVVDVNAVFYPLVGLLLGALALSADWGASLFAGSVARSLAVLLVGLVCTGARPHRAFGQLAKACLLTRNRDAAVRMLEGPEDGRSRALAAMVAIVELVCLCQLDRFRPIGLLFAPTLAHCSMVVLAVGSRAARLDGRRTKFAPKLTFNEFAVASALTFSIIFLSSEFLGLLLVLSAAFLTIGLRVLFHRWLDGVTTTVLDATCEVSTLATLGMLALF